MSLISKQTYCFYCKEPHWQMGTGFKDGHDFSRDVCTHCDASKVTTLWGHVEYYDSLGRVTNRRTNDPSWKPNQ